MNRNLLNTQIEAKSKDLAETIQDFYNANGFDTSEGYLDCYKYHDERFYGVNNKGIYSYRKENSELKTITLEEAKVLADGYTLIKIDKDFLIEAHKAACDDWKLKIEEQFPQVFVKKSIQRILEENNLSILNTIMDSYKIKVEENIIKIPLPSANKEWTFAAWEMAKKICNLFTNAFPIHQEHTNGDDSHIYIEVAEI